VCRIGQSLAPCVCGVYTCVCRTFPLRSHFRSGENQKKLKVDFVSSGKHIGKHKLTSFHTDKYTKYGKHDKDCLYVIEHTLSC